jgi:hypothetical protein
MEKSKEDSQAFKDWKAKRDKNKRGAIIFFLLLVVFGLVVLAKDNFNLSFYSGMLISVGALFLWAMSTVKNDINEYEADVYGDAKKKKNTDKQKIQRQIQSNANKSNGFKEVDKDIKKTEKINEKLRMADKLEIVLNEIQQIEIPEVSDFKKVIIENEKRIIEKGGDNQLFSFLKLDSFLRDYRSKLLEDQSGLDGILNISWLKSQIKVESNRTDIDKIVENLNDMSAKLEGRKTSGFDANVDKLFEMGDVIKPVMESQIKTMVFYHNIAQAMMVFYLNDNKIRYFEIYEAFDKLGVFDSSWQKNVLNKLESLELRLAHLSNQLTELNQNFISILEISNDIVLELKHINSGINTNNVIQAISAYQLWRINKNTGY